MSRQYSFSRFGPISSRRAGVGSLQLASAWPRNQSFGRGASQASANFFTSASNSESDWTGVLASIRSLRAAVTCDLFIVDDCSKTEGGTVRLPANEPRA